jgi:GrpB-like predicted nucleotidyltransferase (UPF0157 family)
MAGGSDGEPRRNSKEEQAEDDAGEGVSDMAKITVVDYDPTWPTAFEAVRARVWPVVDDIALAVEHVGSTSVPGLAAKPIIDVSVVVPTGAAVKVAIERLSTLGYRHLGNLGIEGRESFASPTMLPRHHLYVCPQDSLALKNHLIVREHLRTHSEAAAEYGALKRRLAEQFSEDIGGYTEGKSETILAMLRAAGLSPSEMETVERVNRTER